MGLLGSYTLARGRLELLKAEFKSLLFSFDWGFGVIR
jgi:hypothetical protein